VGTIRLKLLKVGAVTPETPGGCEFGSPAPSLLKISSSFAWLVFTANSPPGAGPGTLEKMEAVPAVSSGVEKPPQIVLLVWLRGRTQFVIRTNAQNWKPMQYAG
jgi:hypothetical protein